MKKKKVKKKKGKSKAGETVDCLVELHKLQGELLDALKKDMRG